MSREIDAKIAEHIMGWKLFEGEPGYGRPPEKWSRPSLVLDEIPHYSTDIADAWQVVEHLNNTGIGRLQLTRMGWKGSPAQSWRATFFRDAVSVNSESRADTAPMAICLAALKVAGVKV